MLAVASFRHLAIFPLNRWPRLSEYAPIWTVSFNRFDIRLYELISDYIPRIVSQYKIAPFFTHFFQLFGVAQKIGNFLAL
jgi:hypothetical protein